MRKTMHQRMDRLERTAKITKMMVKKKESRIIKTTTTQQKLMLLPAVETRLKINSLEVTMMSLIMTVRMKLMINKMIKLTKMMGRANKMEMMMNSNKINQMMLIRMKRQKRTEMMKHQKQVMRMDQLRRTEMNRKMATMRKEATKMRRITETLKEMRTKDPNQDLQMAMMTKNNQMKMEIMMELRWSMRNLK